MTNQKMPRTTTDKYAMLDGKETPIMRGYYGDLFVKRRGRYRLIQTDEAGCTYVEYPDVTEYLVIETRTPSPIQSETEVKSN